MSSLSKPTRAQTDPAYVESATKSEIERIMNSAVGERNAALNTAALKLGHLVAGGLVGREQVRNELLRAAAEIGLTVHEARRTIDSGLRAGAGQPRERTGRTSKGPATEKQEPDYPPANEVMELWQGSRPIDNGMETPEQLLAADFLRARGLSVAGIDEMDLARVLPSPSEYEYPSWWPWAQSAQWILVVPAYDCTGFLRSLHARAVKGPVRGEPKTRWPHGCLSKQLLFADIDGCRLLRGNPDPEMLTVLIVEGLTDYLAASLWASGVLRTRIGVLGVVAGSAPALANIMWPDGVRVAIGTDQDKAGEKYAQEICSAIPRHVPVLRMRWSQS